MSESKSYEDVLEDNRVQEKNDVEDIPTIKFKISPNYKGKNPKSPEELAKMYEERKAKREAEKNKEMVNHPDHYQSSNGIEVIDMIAAFTKDLDGVEAFDVGNIIKYVTRYKKKNGLEDVKKAAWYCNHLVEYLESKSK